MRILYLCHRAPYPPDKGDRMRAFHHLAHLARHHHVHLLSLADDPDSAARAEWGWQPEFDIASMCDDMLEKMREAASIARAS